MLYVTNIADVINYILASCKFCLRTPWWRDRRVETSGVVKGNICVYVCNMCIDLISWMDFKKNEKCVEVITRAVEWR